LPNYLENVLQANLSPPTRIVVGVRTHIVIGVVEELVLTVAGIGDGRIIPLGAGVTSPFCAEHVGNVHHVKRQFDGVGLLARLETVTVSEVEVKMVFKLLVVGVTLEIFAPVIRQIILRRNPRLHVGALLVFGVFVVGLERHLVYLSVGGDENQVVFVGTFAVEVAVIINAVSVARNAGVEERNRCLPMSAIFLGVSCRGGDAVRNVVGGESKFRIVGVAVSVVVVIIALCNARTATVYRLSPCEGV